MLVRQGDNEPLENYMRRFNQEAMQVEDFTDQAAIQAMLVVSGRYKIMLDLLIKLAGPRGLVLDHPADPNDLGALYVHPEGSPSLS